MAGQEKVFQGPEGRGGLASRLPHEKATESLWRNEGKFVYTNQLFVDTNQLFVDINQLFVDINQLFGFFSDRIAT